MKMGTEMQVNNTTKVFTSILVLGLIGLVFLIIFGNLSGNLGFSSSSSVRTNESNSYEINLTTETLLGQSVDGFQSLTVTVVHNATGGNGTIVPATDYNVSSTLGTIVGSPTRLNNWSDVNITYTITFDGESEQNTNQVIGNLTGGAVEFFSFSNVWFVLLAVVLLIVIALSVVRVVKGSKGDSTMSN